MSAPLPSPPPANDPTPRRGLTITVERSIEGLAAHSRAWELLAAQAADPNPFYEPYALLAALARLPEGKRVEVVLVWAPDPLPKQPALLVGLVPLVRHARYKGLPIRTLATWKHLYAYLGTPLIRADRTIEVLESLFAWARTQASLFVWNTISSDTAVRHALTDVLNRYDLVAYQEERHTRAVFRPATSVQAYLDRALGGKKHKELRRQQRRLGELGPLTVHELARDADPAPLISQFLELEARGWKGHHGTAMKDDPTARALFTGYLRGAHERGRLDAWTIGFQAAALPIAMKINLRAGDGALAFKIAYDESLAKYSPGVLLELEHIEAMHRPGAPAWVDSGAAAEHPMINHLWRDRLGIETLVIATGDRAGSVAAATLPLARLARSALKTFQRAKP